MNERNQFKKINLGVIVLSLAAIACGSFQIGIQEPETAQPETAPTQNLPEPDVLSEGLEEVADQVQVTEVNGWLGKISSLPQDSQYDDYLSLSPAGTGEFGLIGANQEIEAEIRSLRDAQGPNEYVHVWGELRCEDQDYNGCQLTVDRLQYGANFSEQEISGWVGTVKSGTFNSGETLIFELAGGFPMWFSIHASQDQALRSELDSLQDTSSLISVSGKLLVGVPDVNGTRIEVSGLEILEAGEVQLTNQGEVNPAHENWGTFSSQRYGYQIQHPEDAVLEFSGPISFSPDELPGDMDPGSYLEQLTKTYTEELCVAVKYSLGVIYISAPPNQEYQYNPCGPTGVGAGQITERTGAITIDGQAYPVSTMEVQLMVDDGTGVKTRGETLDMHNELNWLVLDDNTRIFFGSVPRTDATYDDYLMKTRETLLSVISTYQAVK